MNVYRLGADHRYQGLMSVGDTWKHTIWWFRGESRADTWVPLPVVYNAYEAKLPRGDQPGFRGCPILTTRATDTLRTQIAETGELLPLMCDEEPLQAFNVTTVRDDVLDLEQTEAGRFSTGHLAHTTKYVFFPEALRDATFFRIEQTPSGVYVTDSVVKTVRDAGLQGFAFELVWSSDNELAAPEPKPEVLAAESQADADVREEALPSDDLEVLSGAAQEALDYLHLTGREEPKLIVKLIAAGVDELRKYPLEQPEEARHAAMLGALFGVQVVRAYAWEWAQIGSDERLEYAVAAPDRSMYLEPLHFIWQFLMGKDRDSTVQLLFNMLERPHPEMQAGDYQLVC